MRPIACPTARLGAMQSVTFQYGNPRRQITTETVRKPPIKPP